jgi:hypothetical protein
MCAHDANSYGRGGAVVTNSISACELPKWRASLRRRQMLGRTKVGQRWAGDCGKGLSNASAHDSPADEDYDILSKLSASSLHQMMHIHEPDTRRFGGGGGDRSVAARGNAIQCAEIATVSFARLNG